MYPLSIKAASKSLKSIDFCEKNLCFAHGFYYVYGISLSKYSRICVLFIEMIGVRSTTYPEGGTYFHGCILQCLLQC